jgi:hypothetical protein
MKICPIIYDSEVCLYGNIVRNRNVEALGRSKVKYENVYKLSIISGEVITFDNSIAGRIHEALLNEIGLRIFARKALVSFSQFIVFSHF